MSARGQGSKTQNQDDNKHWGSISYVWPSSTQQPICNYDVLCCKAYKRIRMFWLGQSKTLIYIIGERLLKPPIHKTKEKKTNKKKEEAPAFSFPLQVKWVVLASNLSKANNSLGFCSVSLISSPYPKTLVLFTLQQDFYPQESEKHLLEGRWADQVNEAMDCMVPATDSTQITAVVRIRPSCHLGHGVPSLKRCLQDSHIFLFFLHSLFVFIIGPGNFANSVFPLCLQLGPSLPGPVEHKESL